MPRRKRAVAAGASTCQRGARRHSVIRVRCLFRSEGMNSDPSSQFLPRGEGGADDLGRIDGRNRSRLPPAVPARSPGNVDLSRRRLRRRRDVLMHNRAPPLAPVSFWAGPWRSLPCSGAR